MARSSGGKIVTDGLVLALDAANDKSYPGTGTTWTDLSGNGNNGTLVNGVSATFGDGNLNYTLVNYSSGHPTNTTGLTNVFTIGTNVQTGIHTGNIAWGSSGQSIRWGGNVGTYPSYHTRTQYYGWKVEGYIYLPETGNYQFLIDGDDACDFFIDGQLCSYWYGGHGFGTGATGTTKYFTSGWYTFEARMEEQTGGDGIAVGWKKPSDSSYQTIPSAVFSTTKSTRSLTFDGSNDYVSLPFNTTYTVNNDHTILMWVKSDTLLNSNNNNRVTPYKEGTSTNSWNPGLWYHGTNIRAHTNGAYVDVAWTQDTGWHQIGQVYDYSTNTLKVILDGVSYTGTFTSYSPGSASGTLFIANPITTSTVFFDGKIGMFQTYNRALSSTEISQNFNATRGRFGI